MKDRVFKNWRTSLLGLALIGVSTAALFMGYATFEQFAAFLPFCLGFIYVKDSVFKLNG